MERINLLALDLIKSSSENRLLALYLLILPITRIQIFRIRTKLHLPSDVVYDMEQDAFLKLREVLPNFDQTRSQNFVAFWSKVLQRHLLTTYYSSRRFVQLNHDVCDENEHLGTYEENEFAGEVYNIMLRRINAWRNERHKLLCLSLLNYKFFPMDEEKTQATIAKELGFSQGLVSCWERWLIGECKQVAERLLQVRCSGG
jgi:hypothetical protein